MNQIYHYAVLAMTVYAAATFVSLFVLDAPYGKFLKKGWGPTVNAGLGWMIMELPSPALMVYFFVKAPVKDNLHVLFLMLWLSHYLYRTFIYAFIQPGKNKPYPLLLVLMAILFNVLNGSLNGYEVFHVHTYPVSWLYSVPFIAGLVLFVLGFVINKQSDFILIALRKKNPGTYSIPRGGLFRYISCPHYFGELIEWLGWALMTWSLSGLLFFLFTFANLFPRALSSHRWYHKHFKNYPENRKAVIPYII